MSGLNPATLSLAGGVSTGVVSWLLSGNAYEGWLVAVLVILILVINLKPQPKPPVKLWLDDERHAPHGWVWCKTVEDAQQIAKQAYDSGLFEACSLDHDLAQGEGKEGHDFLRWMIENRICPDLRPTVHTANAYESRMMTLTIQRYWPWE